MFLCLSLGDMLIVFSLLYIFFIALLVVVIYLVVKCLVSDIKLP